MPNKQARVCINCTENEVVVWKAQALYEGRSLSALAEYCLNHYCAAIAPSVAKMATEYAPFVPNTKYGPLIGPEETRQ